MKALKYKGEYELDALGKVMKYRDDKAIEVDIDWLCNEEGCKREDFRPVPYPYD